MTMIKGITKKNWKKTDNISQLFVVQGTCMQNLNKIYRTVTNISLDKILDIRRALFPDIYLPCQE
jgi:hypothetical protein